MTEPRYLGGRYELGDVIGHGGMAEVRIGIDRRLGRTVAVKTLRVDLATDPTFQARFRREAQSAAGLNHPSIVAVYDTGEEKVGEISVPYIVMEYVQGRTLRDVLREGRRILPERAMEITGDILEALEYSHRAGIVHRDIKPANVMLTPSGDVKVMDFGIARAVADASATMTQTAAVIGTAQYLSPEQARGESVDARSDIYSTGCLLYELLTSRPPFVGDSPVSVAYQHVREEPRPPSMVDPEVPPEGDAITLKALQKKPYDRYQSAAEMRADIDRALAGQRVAAPVVPVDATARFMPPDEVPSPYPINDNTGEQPGDEMSEKEKRNRRLAYILLTIAVVFVLGVAAFILTQMMGGDDEPKNVLVPTMIGKTVEQATADLTTAGLRVGAIKNVANDEVPKGQIISTNPAAGAPIAPNSEVELTVSSGQQLTAVPPVVGLKLDAATKKLEAAGFQVSEKEDESSDAEAGEVLASDPAEGTQQPPNTVITLTYSAGLVEVPNVVGETEQVAEATLVDKGFKVKRDYQESTTEDPGTVIEQVPGEGERKKVNSTVTIIVATEPDVEPSPSDTPDPSPSASESESPSPDPTASEEEGGGLELPGQTGRSGTNEGQGIFAGWSSFWRTVFG